MAKVKISYNFKGDASIIQQEIDVAVKKTLKELEQEEANNPNSNFK